MRPTKPIEVLWAETVPGYASAGTLQCERRSHQRYPITLDVEFKAADETGAQRKGFGRTINISSRGILLDVSDPLPHQGLIQLSINWPSLLNGSIPLQLLMYGNIVRVAGNRIGVRVIGHEFHLARPATQQA